MIAKTFHIYSNSGGCPQNQLDGGRLVRYLLENNYKCAGGIAGSDIIIINSCSYNSLKEKQSFEQTLKFCNEGKKKKLIILTGCLPKIAPHLLTRLPGDVKIFAGCDLQRIEEIIPPQVRQFEQIKINYIPGPIFHYSKTFRRIIFRTISFLRRNLPLTAVHHFDRLLMYDHSSSSFIVEICKGCLGNCTYCAIRYSRGRLISRPVEDILSEIRRGVDEGVSEIVLTATETAAYGIDIGTSLSTLLKSILEITSHQKILIFYANPRWLISDWENLKAIFATGKIHFIHLSLNGGSNNVLKAMKRSYTLEEFERMIRSLKTVSPGTVLQTQVITGFPGESEDDFRTTLEFFRRNYFHNVQVHAFDPRPGTEAAEMPFQVSDRVKQKRRRILYRKTLGAKVAYNLSYIMHGLRP